jgi:hypothetical protein
MKLQTDRKRKNMKGMIFGFDFISFFTFFYFHPQKRGELPKDTFLGHGWLQYLPEGQLIT